MIITDLLIFLLLIFNIYLFIQLIQSTLFFIYLLQLKEYRLDRILVHLNTPTGKKQLIDNLNIIKWKKTYYPSFTGRACLTLLIIGFFYYHLFFLFLRFFYLLIHTIYGSLWLAIILNFWIFIFLNPLFTFLTLKISGLLALPIKQLIFFLVAKKIKTGKGLLVIGITGSYGKTTTKEILSFLLEKDFKLLKTPFNCNTKLGIALLILKKLKSEHEIFIVEMGAYKRGEIKELCQMVKPKIGILTGINEQHLALFGSLKNTITTKYELIRSLPANGLAIFNEKDKYVLPLAKKTKKEKKLYGKDKNVYKTQLAGDWHQQAIQAALIVGEYLGLAKQPMIKRLAKFKNFSLAIKINKGKKRVTIIDDSYNSNPDGFRSALDLLAKMPGKEKILVTSGIIELGSVADKIHQELGRKAGLICTKIFLTTADFEQSIIKGIKKVKSEDILEVEDDPKILLEKLSKYFNKNNIILLEGRVAIRFSIYQKKHDRN